MWSELGRQNIQVLNVCWICQIPRLKIIRKIHSFKAVSQHVSTSNLLQLVLKLVFVPTKRSVA